MANIPEPTPAQIANQIVLNALREAEAGLSTSDKIAVLDTLVDQFRTRRHYLEVAP